MSSDSDEWDSVLIPLAAELMTAATGDADSIDCTAWIEEDADTVEKLHRLIAILATFGGEAISEWARDLGVSAAQLMQSIVLDTQNP